MDTLSYVRTVWQHWLRASHRLPRAPLTPEKRAHGQWVMMERVQVWTPTQTSAAKSSGGGTSTRWRSVLPYSRKCLNIFLKCYLRDILKNPLREKFQKTIVSAFLENRWIFRFRSRAYGNYRRDFRKTVGIYSHKEPHSFSIGMYFFSLEALTCSVPHNWGNDSHLGQTMVAE